MLVEYSAQSADTCVVHRQEALLHQEMFEVLVIHWDLSHHVARHITRKTTRLPVIETIRVFVSKHLTDAEAVSSSAAVPHILHTHSTRAAAVDRFSKKAANHMNYFMKVTGSRENSSYLCPVTNRKQCSKELFNRCCEWKRGSFRG